MRCLHLFGCVFALGVLSASVLNAQSYSTILGVNDSVTGIRGTDTSNSGNALLTGSQVIGGEPQVLLWEGNIYNGSGNLVLDRPRRGGHYLDVELLRP